MRKLDKGKLKSKKDRKEKQENTNIKKGGKKGMLGGKNQWRWKRWWRGWRRKSGVVSGGKDKRGGGFGKKWSWVKRKKK